MRWRESRRQLRNFPWRPSSRRSRTRIRGDHQMFTQEHDAVGVPIGERAPRMEEGIRLMRELWTGEEVTNPEGFYPLDQVVLEPQPVQDTVPIWLASSWVRRGLRRVAELGDAWITNVPTVEVFNDCWEKISEHAQSVGRDPQSIRRCLYISVNLNSEEGAMAEGDGFM